MIRWEYKASPENFKAIFPQRLKSALPPSKTNTTSMTSTPSKTSMTSTTSKTSMTSTTSMTREVYLHFKETTTLPQMYIFLLKNQDGFSKLDWFEVEFQQVKADLRKLQEASSLDTRFKAAFDNVYDKVMEAQVQPSWDSTRIQQCQELQMFRSSGFRLNPYNYKSPDDDHDFGYIHDDAMAFMRLY